MRLKGLPLLLYFAVDGSMGNKATVQAFVEIKLFSLAFKEKDCHVIYFPFEQTITKPCSHVNRDMYFWNEFMFNLSHTRIQDIITSHMGRVIKTHSVVSHCCSD